MAVYTIWRCEMNLSARRISLFSWYLNILFCFRLVRSSIIIMNVDFGLISGRRFIAPAVRHTLFILAYKFR